MQFSKIKYAVLIFVGMLLFYSSNAQNSNVDSLLFLLQNQDMGAFEEADVCYNIGVEYLSQSEYPLAVKYANTALSHFSKIRTNKQYVNSLKLLGDIYSRVNDFDKSLEYYLDALVIAESMHDEQMIAAINSEMARLFIKLAEYDKALQRFKLSITYYEKAPEDYSVQLVTNYANIGVTYGSISMLDSALMYFEKAYDLYSEDDLINRAGVLNNIGAIKYKQERFSEAMEYYNRAFDLFTEADANNGIGIALFNMAQIYLEFGNSENAEKYFEEAMPYLEKSGELFYLYKCYEQLSDFNEKRGRLDQSLKYHKLYSITKDSILNVETLNKISSLQMQFEIRKVEHKIQILERDAKLKQIKEYVLIGSIVLLFIISSLLFFNLRNKIRNNKLHQKLLSQEKEKLKNELEYKNKELENFALHIVQKNELLNSVRDEIKNVGQDYSKLKDIKLKISQNLYLEKDREEFQSFLEQIHKSFFLKLNQNFPDLTQSDKRLCALLAIDLSTKDIAAIINISPDSVKKSRYRLRKKLKLETDDNLSEFLKKM